MSDLRGVSTLPVCWRIERDPASTQDDSRLLPPSLLWLVPKEWQAMPPSRLEKPCPRGPAAAYSWRGTGGRRHPIDLRVRHVTCACAPIVRRSGCAATRMVERDSGTESRSLDAASCRTRFPERIPELRPTPV